MPSPLPSSDPDWNEWTSATLPASLDQIGGIIDRMRSSLAARGVPEGELTDGLILAVTEAVTNAIRHGRHPGRPDERIRLAWVWRNEEIELEVSEPGRFEPKANWGELPDDLLAEGGRGGFLITQLMDAVEHRNHDGRHALRMRKKLRPAPVPAAPASAANETEAALDAMTEELSNAYETISALFQFSASLATEPGLQELALKSFSRLRPITGADDAWIRLAEPDGALVAIAGGGDERPRRLPADSAACEAEVARFGLERTLQHRRSLPADDPLHGAAGCAFVCPFSFEGRLRGVLTVVREHDRAGFFTAGQIALVRTLADFLGIACASADLQDQRLQRLRSARELEIAAQIQHALLPDGIAPHPAWSVLGVCEQATAVGGDFFDVIDLRDGGRLVVIADVMGKGVPAALMATTLRTALRALAAGSPEPAALLTAINRLLCPDLQRLQMFITAQLLLLDPQGAGVTFASAAHCPVLLLNAAGQAFWHEANGLPLGVDASENYASGFIAIAPWDRLLMMTDGALEQRDAADRELGTAGLADLARNAWREAPDNAGAAILRALETRAAGHPANDDCTLVAITRTPDKPNAPP